MIAAERWLLLAVVGILPLTYTAGILLDNYNLPKLALVMAVVPIAGGMRLGTIVLGIPSSGLRRLALPAGAMASAYVFAWLFTDYRAWSVIGFYTRYGGLLPYISVILFAVLLADAFAGSPRPVIVAVVLGAAGVGVGALIQMLFFGFDIGTVSQTAYVTSTVGHSNFLGGYLGIVFCMSVGLWLGEGRLARIGMITTIPIFCGLLFSVSQGGWLAGSAGTAAVLGLRLQSWRPWAKRLGILLGSALIALAVTAVLVTMAIPHASTRVPSYLHSTVSRGLLWEHALTLGSEKPLFGWGPNVYAIEGPLHRSVEDAVLQDYILGDDPHSVPLALLANLGLFGVAAFVFALLWAFRGAARSTVDPGSVLPIIGGLVGYTAQALVSIDEMTIRFNFWVLLALVACLATPRPQSAHEPRPRAGSVGGRRAIAFSTLLLGLTLASVAITSFVVADYHIKKGLRAYDRGKVQQARQAFQRGLSLREDYSYRRVYGRALGQLAFQQGAEGGPLINEMNDVFSYLDKYPDPQTLALQGQLLDQWSLIQPQALQHSLAVFNRVRELDPYNPNAGRDTADILMTLGRNEEAERVLEPYERLLTEDFPEYSAKYGEFWASLAIARGRQGKIAEARNTLDRAGRTGGCRFLIASFILLDRDRGRPDRTLGLICPGTLLRLLPDWERGTSSVT